MHQDKLRRLDKAHRTLARFGLGQAWLEPFFFD
jgi:hypothetical protein